MQFTLQTLLLAFVVVACSMSLAGMWGFLLAPALLGCAGFIRIAKSRQAAWMIVGIILSVFLIAFVFPAMSVPRICTESGFCANNMRNIAIALLAYKQEHGRFPPPYVADADGKPMHSWRTLILPYLEYPSIYKAYDFKERWNGPNNSKLSGKDIHILQCPSDTKNKLPGHTNYVAVVGPDTVWPGDESSTRKRIAKGDGESETLLLVELPDSDIPWSEPRDLSFEELCHKMTPEQRAKIFNAHNGKAAVVYADGHSEVLTEPFLQKNIEALLTVNGGEKVDFDDQPLASDAHRLHYRTVAAIKIIVSLIVLIAVLLWMIHRPLPKENTKEEEEIQRENTSDPQVQAMEGEITQPSDPLSQDGEGQVG